MAGVDVNNLIMDIAGGNNALRENQNQVNSIAQSAFQDAGKLEGLNKSIAESEAKGEQAAGKMGIGIAEALGVDRKAATNRLTELAQIKTQSSDAAMGLLDQAQQMESTNFFTNPMGYIINNLDRKSVV